ncbi:MAG: tripartite tricarboxylate transporter permease [Rhodospirillales bacterium]|nr:tripartite tricarboxylate transporter permease [Rhodospirillales bacterium]
MFESLISGMLLVVQWPTFGYLILGVIFGLWLGAVPGLGGIIGVVIILPFTFDMDPVPAFALILGLFAVTATSDTISSVMLGIPGTAASQATVLDGYPMAKRGEAARAFGAAFTASAIGGVLGGVAMAVSLPIIKPLILSFGSPEFFLLGILGLTMVGTVSGASVSKGIAAALVGLMISQIGFPVASEEPRFWFEIQYLIDGVPLIPLVLGLFAIPELMELAVKNTSISRVPQDQGGGMMEGIRDAFRFRWLLLRCSAIGIYIGMLPGLGAMIADWVAYGHAVQSTKVKDNPKFGEGDIRGVIAPEAANNAVMGGALIPTVGLGIPGSASMAILLGAFVIKGLHPGREMLTTKLDVTFSMIWMLIIANIFGALLLMLWSKQVAKASFINGHLIVPGVILFIFMGGWLQSPDIANWILLLGVGIVGYIMKQCGWPRPALVLGFVLGPIMESALVLSAQSFSMAEVLSRPLTLILIAVLAGAFLLAVRGTKKAKLLSQKLNTADDAVSNPFMSLPFAIILFCLMVAAIPTALLWPWSAKLFPLTITPAAAILLAFAIYRDFAEWRARVADCGGKLSRAAATAFGAEEHRSALFILCVVALVALTPIIGQQPALIAFVFLYLLTWGRFSLGWAALYAAGAWGVLYFLYDKLLHVPWMLPFFME